MWRFVDQGDPAREPASGRTSTSISTRTGGSAESATKQTGSATTTAPHSSSGVSPTTAAKATPRQLAAVQQELDQAGSSLAAGDSAINGSDVNQAKAQEGSAP